MRGPISTTMAKAMGKDVDKFLRGGQNKGNTTVEEEKPKPKPTEKPKKKEEPKKPSEINLSKNEKEALEKQALSCTAVQKYLDGNTVKKIIAVPNKIVNIVV